MKIKLFSLTLYILITLSLPMQAMSGPPGSDTVQEREAAVSALQERVTVLKEKTREMHSVSFVYQDSIGGFGSSKGFFNQPMGLSGDNRYLYISDSKNRRIIKYDLRTKSIEQFSELPDTTDSLDSTYGILLFSGIKVLVTDRMLHRVLVYSDDGIYENEFGQLGIDSGQLNTPSGLGQTKTEEIVICDTDNNRIQLFERGILTKNRAESVADYWIRDFGESDLNAPQFCTVTQKGDILVTDRDSLKKFDIYGNLIQSFDLPLQSPKGVCEDSHQNIYVVDQDAKCVWYIDKTGVVLGQIAEPLQAPVDVFVDQDQVYVSDKMRHEVLVFQPINPSPL